MVVLCQTWEYSGYMKTIYNNAIKQRDELTQLAVSSRKANGVDSESYKRLMILADCMQLLATCCKEEASGGGKKHSWVDAGASSYCSVCSIFLADDFNGECPYVTNI